MTARVDSGHRAPSPLLPFTLLHPLTLLLLHPRTLLRPRTLFRPVLASWGNL